MALELLAGNIGGPGNADGTGAAARFNAPAGVAVDSAGNVYVADTNNDTIRKVTAAGVVTTLAGAAGIPGIADGAVASARFQGPAGVAVDSAGNLYVADQLNCTIRRVAGVVLTVAGTAGICGSADGTGSAARFNTPAGVAIDGAGTIYVADRTNDTIRKITLGVVTTLAGTATMSGSADGTGAAARFDAPSGIAVDSTGTVYVADTVNSTIRKVTPAGVVTTLAGTAGMSGSADGTGAAARFGAPSSIAVDIAGNLYVADQGNSTIRKVTPAGVVTTLAGTALMTGSADGTGAAARFAAPSGIAVDSAGNVYVTDMAGNTLRKVTAAGVVTTLAGAAAAAGSADGTGAAARFNFPAGVAVDSASNVYVADQVNDIIRKITPAGVVTTLAGAAGMAGSTDGTGDAARFDFPFSVALDSAGNLIVADQLNCILRKITPAGVVTTLAGTASGGSGACSSVDGTGAAARFNHPFSVTIDGADNVYVADRNSSILRKVTPAGVVTTLAGTAGMKGSADGTGADARFNAPFHVAVDSAGNVYVADQGNSTLRKVTPTGTTTTVAGIVGANETVLGATPRFIAPRGVAIGGDSIVFSSGNAILLLRHGVE